MCLGIPGKVSKIYEKDGLKMGTIDYGGTTHEACLEYVPEIELNQYTIIHAGFAISVIDEDDALKSLEAWKELLDMDEETNHNDK